MLSSKAFNLLNVGKISTRYTASCLNSKRCVIHDVASNKVPENLRAEWPKASFNISKMQELLDHDNHQMRNELRTFLSDPVFKPKYNISLEEERAVNTKDVFIIL